MLDRPWLLEEAASFPVTWFLKLAGNYMPLWEEGIAVSVSEPVTGVVARARADWLVFFPTPARLTRLRHALSSDSRVASTLDVSRQAPLLFENLPVQPQSVL